MTIDTKASREKMAKRTPGRWFVGHGTSGQVSVGTCTKKTKSPSGVALLLGVRKTHKNAEAICHAVNTHDALCDEIDRLRATNAELRKLVTIQCDHPGCGVLHKASNPCPMGHKP